MYSFELWARVKKKYLTSNPDLEGHLLTWILTEINKCIKYKFKTTKIKRSMIKRINLKKSINNSINQDIDDWQLQLC